MRTLPTGLAAALLTNPPYVTIVGNDDTSTDKGEANVLEYSLTQHSLKARIELGTSALDSLYQLRIRRGAVIAGTATYIESSRLWPRSRILHETYEEIEASLFPASYITAAGYNTYQQVLTDFCTAIGYTAAFSKPAALFWQYQFLPDGRSLIMNDSRHILSLLQQKFLIQAMDAGSETIRFFCIPDTDAEATQTLAGQRLVEFKVGTTKTRQFLWRDELSSIHTAGLPQWTIHNLGYLETGTNVPLDDFPLNPAHATSSVLEHIVEVPINLEIETGDRFSLTGVSTSFRARTVEFFQHRAGKHPEWKTTLYNNEWFQSTEAGALPSTIEAAAPYTPLNVSHFNSILSSSDNNIQAAFETVDDLTAAGRAKPGHQ